MIKAVMGIDSSTQSCTIELREVDSGKLISTGRAPHPKTFPPVSEQHPDAWWQALQNAIADGKRNAEQEVDIVALSVGAQCHGMTLLDEKDQVIRPAKLWNDTTSGDQASRIVEKYGDSWWAKEIGLVPSAALTITKLIWLKENEPENFGRIAKMFVPHDYLTYRLTGNHVSDRSDSSGTGYFDATNNVWRFDILNDLLGAADWQPRLPTVLAPDEMAGQVLPEVAELLGLNPKAVVAPGGGDQHLAAQGVGLVPGDVTYSLGTSGVVFATTDVPIHDEFVDGVANTTGGFLPLICTLNAAKVTDAMARLLGVDHGELSRLALSAKLDADRPIMAAYMDGERTPKLPCSRAMMSGISSDVSREELALSAFEGVVLGLWRGERQIVECGVEISGKVIAIGGGAKSQAYRQVIADLTGHPTCTVDAPEGTARGAAVQAAAIYHQVSVADQTKAWQPPVTSVTEPKNDRSDIYQRYLKLADLQADGSTF